MSGFRLSKACWFFFPKSREHPWAGACRDPWKPWLAAPGIGRKRTEAPGTLGSFTSTSVAVPPRWHYRCSWSCGFRDAELSLRRTTATPKRMRLASYRPFNVFTINTAAVRVLQEALRASPTQNAGSTGGCLPFKTVKLGLDS